jgi:hypothetical protein
MSYLKELIDEIKKSHKDSLLFSELSKYRARYMDYYDKNVSAHPKSGFFHCMSWDAERRNEFHKEFDKLKYKVIDDPVEPLHDYDLQETGMNRLHELERKIKRA